MTKQTLTCICIFTIIFLLAVFLTFSLEGPKGVYTKASREYEKVIVIEKGKNSSETAEFLKVNHLIENRFTFYLALLWEGKWGKLKAGEYLIPKDASPADIVNIFASGKVIQHKLTIPEGLTVSEMVNQINEIPILKGDITKIPPEGYLMPETYTYVYGDDKQKLINRLETNMKTNLEKCWKERNKNLPFKTPHEALVLASIVEKETGISGERSRVAAVFINRLKLGMKLQADPTVIYGLTLGKTKLERPLTKVDLKSQTPYNTYVIEGLPPHPIACPGKAALHATLHPLETKDLYFVANGTGGHSFSNNLSQHNQFVRQSRLLIGKKELQ